MNKVFLLAADEDWIVDRFVKEWTEDNSDITVNDPRDAEVLWLLAGWCWKKVPQNILSSKKVIVTVHHIVPEKFDSAKLSDFYERDKYVDAYHVYNERTLNFIRSLTKKPIHLIGYWANQKIWKQTSTKNDLRKKHGIPADAYPVVGSFQRDTEGHDLKSPKLEKGPDTFVDYVSLLKQTHKDTHVVLAGWRRQYVKKRLDDLGISYSYFELPSQTFINELYQCLDHYAVTSRHEGGPQALIECGLTGTPVVSTPVGIAEQVLSQSSINQNVIDAVPSIPNVKNMLLPGGYEKYRMLIDSV